MSRMKRTRWLVLMFLILAAGGCGLFASKATVIKKAIEALESKRAELLAAHPQVKDVAFKKDDDGDGVLIEYTFKEGTKRNEGFDADAAKTNLIRQFKDNEGIKTVLGYGVYLRFVYKTSDDQVLADTKLEASDL